jgi:hypothetical protein
LEAATPVDSCFLYFLQETYNWKLNPCGLTKSFLHFKPDVDCRAAIYASPELGLTFHDKLSNRDCATASIKVDGDRVYFSSVYLHTHLTIKEPAWLLTLQKSTCSCSHMIAGVDSNLHSDVWGPTSNRRRTLMETLLFKYELCVLNEGNSPTFETRQAASCIYITVATPALASLVNKWTVQNEMHMSDHHLITMELLLCPDKMPLHKGRNLKTADWEEFRHLIDISLADYQDPILWSTATVDQTTQLLHNAIDTALDAVSPISPYRPKKAMFLWWYAELAVLRSQTRRAQDYARRRPGDDARWQDYKSKQRKLKNESIKARTKSWREFTADQVSPKQAARLHRILQRQAYNKLSLLKRDDGSITESPEESNQLLMQEHFPGSMPLQAKKTCAADFDPNETSTSPTHPVLVDGRSWINHTTVDLALKQFGKHKCLGPDGYRPIVLCNLPHTARTLLIQVFNAYILLKYTPKLWRSSEVIFLPKPGKDDNTERRAFRPISLMPFLFKTLESLVKWRMEQHATPLHKD